MNDIPALFDHETGPSWERPNWPLRPHDDLTAGAVESRIAEGLRRERGAEADLSAVEVQVGPAEGELLVALTYQRLADRVTRTLEVLL